MTLKDYTRNVCYLHNDLRDKIQETFCRLRKSPPRRQSHHDYRSRPVWRYAIKDQIHIRAFAITSCRIHFNKSPTINQFAVRSYRWLRNAGKNKSTFRFPPRRSPAGGRGGGRSLPRMWRKILLENNVYLAYLDCIRIYCRSALIFAV